MKVLILFAVLVALLCAAASRMLAIDLGLDGGTPDWRIVLALVFATMTVYATIRA